MISKLSAKYQLCAIRTADTRDGQLTTPGVYTWVVRELSMICPSFVHRLYPPHCHWLGLGTASQPVWFSKPCKHKLVAYLFNHQDATPQAASVSADLLPDLQSDSRKSCSCAPRRYSPTHSSRPLLDAG